MYNIFLFLMFDVIDYLKKLITNGKTLKLLNVI